MDHTFRAGSLRADHRRRAGVVVASAITVAALAAATGSATASAPPDSATTGSAAPVNCGTSDDVTLTVGLFGTFGFKENGLYDEYKKVCPEHHDQGGRRRAVGGLLDAAARPGSRRAAASPTSRRSRSASSPTSSQNHADQFVNFNDAAEAPTVKAEFYDWKWKQASSRGRPDTVGLGTDIGPQAICYRQDLLEQAGLPSRPRRARPRSGRPGTTSSPSARSTRRRRPSPATRTSWTAPRASSRRRSTRATRPTTTPTASPTPRTATACRQHGGTPPRRRRTASPPACSSSRRRGTRRSPAARSPRSPAPTWMMGYIQGQAGPDGAGKWNIAPVLPGGATNWGGSWLGVPDRRPRTRRPPIALVEWLSATEQQVTMWTSQQGGHFPSNPGRRRGPGGARPPRAPTSATRRSAQIFGDIAAQMKIPPIGLYDTQIQNAFTTAADQRRDQGHRPGRRVQRRPGRDRAGRRLSRGRQGRLRRPRCRPAPAARHARPGERESRRRSEGRRAIAARPVRGRAGGAGCPGSRSGVRLHRAVLHASSLAFSLYPWLDTAWVSLHDVRLTTYQSDAVGRPRQLPQPAAQQVLLERASATPSRSASSRPSRSCAWRSASRTCSTTACAAGRSSGSRC